MRKSSLLLLFLAFMFPAAPQVAVADVIRVGVNHAPPYRIITAGVESRIYSGFYIDVLEDAARRAGLEIQYTEMPFKRALASMKEGSIDVMLGPNKTAEREEYMEYLPASLPAEKKIVIARKDSEPVQDFTEPGKSSMGVLRGVSYLPALRSRGFKNLVEIKSNETLIRMLAVRRLDTVIMPELQAAYLAVEEGLEIRNLDISLDGTPSFITVSRSSGFYQSREKVRFEKELDAIKSSGRMREIYNEYLLPN